MCTGYQDSTPTNMPALLARRGFLKAAAAAALTAGAAGVLPRQARAAEPAATPADDDDEPGRVPLEQISMQLYTMRSVMDNDLDGTFAGLADIGYRQVEHAGFHGRSAPEFRAALDAHGLSSTSGHQKVPYPWDELAWRRTVDDAFILGQSSIVEPLPYFALPGLFTPVSAPSVVWGNFAEAMNKAAEIAKIYGIRVGYHNHNVEFRPLPDAPDKTGYDILLAETDPELVHFELDLYWAWNAETDPVDLLEAHPTRFRQFHVKDMDTDGNITAPGEGIIDFARIFAVAESLAVDEFTIEQDNAGNDAMTSAQLGYDLLRDIRW